MDKIGRAVEGVNDPGDSILQPVVGGFFRNDGMVGEASADAIHDQGFRCFVHGGDIVKGSFGVDVGKGNGAQVLANEVAGFGNRATSDGFNGIKAYFSRLHGKISLNSMVESPDLSIINRFTCHPFTEKKSTEYFNCSVDFRVVQDAD